MQYTRYSVCQKVKATRQRYLFNKKNIKTFPETSYPKRGGEASLGSFYKNSKLSISHDQQFEMLHLPLLCVQVKVYQNILKLKCGPLFLTLSKVCVKKRGLELVPLPDFLNELLTLYCNK